MTAQETKRILLTGCTRGLGRAMLAGFAARGHEVCGAARNAAGVAELTAAYGPPHCFEVVDVRDDARVAAWARSVGAAERPFDLVINNAAIIHRTAPLWELPAEEFDDVLRTNVSGVANVIRWFVPPMVARRRGVIVNFSSGWGRSTSADVAPYCASKFAIEGLTQALAQELPDGMAAVALNPGIINTDMLRVAFGPEAGGYPSPEAWARRAVPFLDGLTARHNGQSLDVPG